MEAVRALSLSVSLSLFLGCCLSDSLSVHMAGQLDGELSLMAMPNNVRATCKAGSALLFDTACYHTAFPCTGPEPRRTAILGYGVSSKAKGKRVSVTGGQSPVARLQQAGLLKRPALRQVLNVEV